MTTVPLQQAPRRPAPRPVPELQLGDDGLPLPGALRFAGAPPPPPPPPPVHVPGGPAPVSDADRNRYGALLDRAAERGLLDAAEYQVRLVALAEATTLEQMHRIVTELPVFSAPPAKQRSGRAGRLRRAPHPVSPLPVPPGGEPVAAVTGPTAAGVPAHRNSWLVLVALVAVLVVSLVVLAVVAAHLAHPASGALATPAARVLSSLRL